MSAPDFDETYDWVVVGSGAGAFVSGLVMRAAGHSVLVLEKTAYAGGTTAKSGGVMWIPANPFMLAEGETDTIEQAETYLDALQNLDGGVAPGTSRGKRRAYLENGPRAIDFLLSKGVRLRRGAQFWPDYYDELPGGCKTSRTVVAEPFDTKQLGPMRRRLRKGFAEFNVLLADAAKVGHARTNPDAKKMLARIALRTVRDKLLGRAFTTAGAALQGRLFKAGLEAGVEIRFDSAVTDLVCAQGRVTGVEVAGDPAPRRIGARLGVLVNAGGFGKNQEMRDRYMPGTRAEWSLVPEGDTGDLHRAMEAAGAQLAQMDQMVGFQATIPPGLENAYVLPGAQSLTGKPHAILVDQTGQRYMNEGGSYELYCETMLRRNREVPAVPSWAIFDAQFTARYKVADTFIDRKIPPGWLETGYLHKADTIAELATSIGVYAGALSATVDRWNGFVRQGRDEDFARGERAYDGCHFVGDPYSEEPSRGTIAKAPFYAVPVVPGDVSTYGGAVTDEHARVLRADGSVIEGLYATGTSTASVMGNVYAGAGASIGPSLTFGFIAARHAAGLNTTAAVPAAQGAVVEPAA
ncbi:FAD-binding protein [Novosphingobium sp. MBES04]|uniref:FAD-binding protein n=1 Tax=Novosphingobium sp. MBES04 TaxID=1206458 RepID=UPI00069393E3|nr:FAD-binding protein [Novosphingobium sp. MBES04]GAM04351.1 3-ketosteroid-delta-1-dehydrogenase [Novosphingobium sp. MBES04]